MGGKIVKWVEAHPFMTAGAVFIGGAVLIYLYYSGGSSASSGETGQDADYQAGLAAQVQLAQLEAQYGAQTTAANDALQSQADQVNGAVQVAQYQEQETNQQTAASEKLGIAQLNDETTAAADADNLQYSDTVENNMTALNEQWLAMNQTDYSNWLQNTTLQSVIAKLPG